MDKKLDCILLIDDNPDDNFFHRIILEESEVVENILEIETAIEALDYLKRDGVYRDQTIQRPSLIFLDINMPGMNGFEFLDEYNKLPIKQKADIVIMMLTTSDNIEDKKKAAERNVRSFLSKPLTVEGIQNVINNHF